ncbi:MAG: chromate resistance protein [Deltaproteobacteria bacterium]|nr:chromate resistance protein [Deltaproteobacteria bacterium]
MLLIHQLPAAPAYLRVKVWRRLQRIGAIGLRGSVYILPRGDQALEDFQWLAREITAAKGEASICEARFVLGASDAELEAMFRAARDVDYQALAAQVRALARRFTKRPPPDAADAIAALRARKAEIVAIDFFGAPGREAVAGLLADLERRLSGPATAPVVRARDHRGRTWVTRSGIQVDRIASAWLIRRFIDPEATFRFVAAKAYVHAPGELRFDMSDGEFTHEGEWCSFETLVHRFGLTDPALHAIAEIIHDIDLKDDRFARPEAAGLAHVLAGLASAHPDDAQRLARGAQLFDDLYAYFASRPPERTARTRARAPRAKAAPRKRSS